MLEYAKETSLENHQEVTSLHLLKAKDFQHVLLTV